MKSWLRNCVYLTALALLSPWLVYRRVRYGRYKDGWKQQFFGLSPRCLRPENGNASGTIWLHGVSVGEVQLLVPLVQLLRVSYPAHRVVLSATTDSGMRLARERLPDVDVFYCPFDFSWAIRRTINTLRPVALILGELELWPNMLEAMQQHSVPTSVVNGRLSERSYRRYINAGFLTRSMFAKLSLVAAQTPTYAERFIACGCSQSSVVVTGNLKFDQASCDRELPEINALRAWAGIRGEHRVIVVGSTQSPEELAGCEAFLQLRKQFPAARLIVVPRHPDRFEEVAKLISNLPVRFARRSDGVLADAQWEVLLVDTVGELRWWWGVAEIAVVGGSFGSRGGQNMLEPAAYGANLAFGANTSNFKDVSELLLAEDGAIRLESLGHLSRWLHEQLGTPEPGRLRGQNAARVIASGRGALDRTLDAIDSQVMAPNKDAARTLEAVDVEPRVRVSA